jgi:hypothetical protein
MNSSARQSDHQHVQQTQSDEYQPGAKDKAHAAMLVVLGRAEQGVDIHPPRLRYPVRRAIIAADRFLWLLPKEPEKRGGSGMAENELNEPVMDGSEQAPVDERISGILLQVKADVAAGSRDTVEQLLRQRFAEAQIDLSDSEIRDLSRSE